LNDVTLLPIDRVVAEVFGQLRAALKSAGNPVPELDALIAATALANSLIVVTNNTKDFANIPGLVIQDWSRP
jgi:tRNA(fMet)-specific endonuclease VapC